MKTPAQILVTNDLKPLLGKVVGWVKLNKSFIDHNANYECAAWWKDSEIQIGVYPMILQENHLYPKDLRLHVVYDAVVVDDYFPALWGGVAVSNKPYTPEYLGEQTKIHRYYDIVDAICQTGNSPDGDMNFCVNPFLWNTFIQALRSNMHNFKSNLDKYWEIYKDNGDGNYLSNLSMVGYCTDHISAISNAIEKLCRHNSYFDNSTNYMANLHVSNTAWAMTGT